MSSRDVMAVAAALRRLIRCIGTKQNRSNFVVSDDSQTIVGSP
jgi:hypothetical protein